MTTDDLTSPTDLPAPGEEFLVAHFIVVEDVARSRDFYVGVLGGTVLMDGEPTVVKLANGFVVINVGGGPTDDKPDIILEPPVDRSHVSAFVNLRVADIQAVYQEWSAKGAGFLTPPNDRVGDALLPARPGRSPDRGRSADGWLTPMVLRGGRRDRHDGVNGGWTWVSRCVQEPWTSGWSAAGRGPRC